MFLQYFEWLESALKVEKRAKKSSISSIFFFFIFIKRVELALTFNFWTQTFEENLQNTDKF
jgi:hypothetical protein